MFLSTIPQMWENIRVYSHRSCLVRLKQTQVCFFSWCRFSGRCEYSNRTRVRTKQPNPGPAEEVVSFCFQTNSGTVRLRCEYEQPYLMYLHYCKGMFWVGVGVDVNKTQSNR